MEGGLEKGEVFKREKGSYIHNEYRRKRGGRWTRKRRRRIERSRKRKRG